MGMYGGREKEREKDNLFGFLLNVDGGFGFPSRQGEFNRIFNVCGYTGFEVRRSKETCNECMESPVHSSIQLEYRRFSK